MDNNIKLSESGKSELKLEDRKSLNLTGVIEVMNFNDEKISLNTTLGMLQINGVSLKINKIDVKNGDVSISGKVKALIYTTKEKRKKRRFRLAKKFLKRE